MKTVATYGVFDIFHQGHVNLLRRARELGDYLIVGVTTNHFDEIRGKLNTTDSFEVRRQAVIDSGFADEVIPETYVGQKIDDIKNRGIDVIVFGSDWEGHFDYLKEYCEVVYLPRTKGISSTALRNARHPEVRVGIVGTGRIARRFVTEALTIGGMRLSAVYNPHDDRAQQFARDEYEPLRPHFIGGDKGPMLATDSWDDFIAEVDAVYIASPHQYHYDQAKAALLAGKHVLCEKPMAFSEAEARELFDLAAERGIVLLEDIKTAYCPGFEELVDVVRSGVIGEVSDVDAAFTRLTETGVRERDDQAFGGSFLEFGTYGLLPAVRLLGPRRVMDMAKTFYSQRDENGIDLFTRAFLSDGTASATIKAGLGVKTEGQLLVSGTEGYILAPAPWWLTSHFEVHHEDPDDVQSYDIAFLGGGLRYAISNFVHLVRSDAGRAPKLSADESIAIASVFECFLEARNEA